MPPSSTRKAKAGFWYKAIRHKDERDIDPRRFAFCAYPAGGEHRFLYVISEENILYRKRITDGSGNISLDVFPSKSELHASWERIE
jgi:hypothetical protein